jgi:cell division protein FtsW (lipid II flippase)
MNYIPYVILGLLMMWGCSRMPKKFMIRFSYVLLGFGIFLLMMSVLNPFMIRGAVRYVPFCGINLNPYMLILPAYLVLVSHWLSKETTPSNLMMRWIGCGLLTALICMAAFFAPYMFMVMTYSMAFVMITMYANKNMPHILKASLLLAAGFFAGVFFTGMSMPHITRRLVQVITGDGYLIEMTHRVMRETGLFWYTNDSIESIGHIPDIATDFMFSGIMGRFGLCTGVLVLMLFIWTGKLILNQAAGTKDRFQKLLCIGALMVFALSVFFNVSTSIGGFMHSSYLPFMSFSRSGMLSFCILFGFLLSKPEQK